MDECCCPCSNVSPDQLDRIEAKLDALLEALASDEAPGNLELTLDGDPIGAERNQAQEL